MSNEPYKRGNQYQISLTITQELYAEIVEIAEQYEWSFNKTCSKLIELGIDNAEELFREIKTKRGK